MWLRMAVHTFRRYGTGDNPRAVTTRCPLRHPRRIQVMVPWLNAHASYLLLLSPSASAPARVSIVSLCYHAISGPPTEHSLVLPDTAPTKSYEAVLQNHAVSILDHSIEAVGRKDDPQETEARKLCCFRDIFTAILLYFARSTMSFATCLRL